MTSDDISQMGLIWLLMEHERGKHMFDLFDSFWGRVAIVIFIISMMALGQYLLS